MGVLRCPPAQPSAGPREGRGWTLGKGSRDKLDKNSIQSRTFERAGAPPPPRSLRQATWAPPSAPSCSRDTALSRREKTPVGQAWNPWSLRLYFQSPPQSRELEGTGSVPAKKDPSAPGPPSFHLKQEPHLGSTSSTGPAMRTRGLPDGFTQHNRRLKAWQLGQLVSVLWGGHSRLRIKEPQSQSRGLAGRGAEGCEPLPPRTSHKTRAFPKYLQGVGF